MTKTRNWLIILLTLALSCMTAYAQVTANASIRGTVLDSTGAVVVGADVTVSNSATGFARTVKTGNDGSYVVEPIPAGVYAVKVSSSGFATATASKVETLVSSTTTQNFTVKAGATTETVEVTSEAPLVDQTKTDVSQNITPTEVQELPMIGRDVANLAYLAPGVKAADSYDPTKARMAILSVNGQNGRNVNVTVNGIDNKDNTVGGPVMQLPLEAVQEFSISTQRFSAANGRSEGAAINMITKSGTNLYHGSLFGYFRDQVFNADEKLTDGTTANPPYSRQQFGGSIGGPFKKDKLFGFFAYERLREGTSLSENPTAFQELTLATPLGAQPAAVIPTPFFENRYNGRADWKINDRHSAYFSVALQANNGLNDQSDGTGDLTNGNFTVNHMQVANLTLNSMLSTSLVNQLTLGFQYWNNLIASNISAPLVTFPGASFGTNTNVPQQSFQRKWQIKDDVSKTWHNHTFKTGLDYLYEPTLGGFFEFSSTLEVDFVDTPQCILQNIGCSGAMTYPQGFATPGAIGSMGIANGDPTTTVPGGTKQFGIYFQDDWKISRRLTMNLGVRWDKDFNMVGGSAVHNSATYKELAALNSPISNPFIVPPNDDSHDFSPRIGFAYDLTGSGKHMLRGGYGLYYGDVFQNIPIFMEQLSNPTIFQQSLSLSSPSDVVPGTGKTLATWRYGVDPFPTIPAPASTLIPGSVGRIIDPNYVNPVSEEFNLGYSWAVSNSGVFETEYVHTLGLHENKTINIDQKLPTIAGCTGPDPSNPCGLTRPLDAAFAATGLPQLASVRDEQSIGRSRYDGINFSYRQRMTHHFSLNTNYTLAWAKSYDGGGGSFRNYPRLSVAPFAPYEYGYSPNDERHHVTISGIFDMPWGFQLSPILQFGSARPYNTVNSSNTLNTGGGSALAVVVPNAAPTNFTAFAGNNPGAQACFYTNQCTIAQYDPLRGDPFFELDTRLAKNFKLGERVNLQLLAQAFNLTNRANYGNNFQGDISTGSDFGKPIGFINPTSTNTPRAVTGEFGFRLSF